MCALDHQVIARLWRSVLQRDPRGIFGAHATRLLNRNWGDQIPQPGYIGPACFEGGLAFISMNPGGMRGDGLGPTDRTQLEALRGLRDCSEGDIDATFDRMRVVLAQAMRTWGIFQKFVQPILECGHLELEQVAYLNLLKWRTQKSTDLVPLYECSWQSHTCEQVALLRPKVVVSIGSDAGKAFRRLYSGGATLFAIPRVIGNNIGAAGRREIDRICKWLASNPIQPPNNPLHLTAGDGCGVDSRGFCARRR